MIEITGFTKLVSDGFVVHVIGSVDGQLVNMLTVDGDFIWDLREVSLIKEDHHATHINYYFCRRE